MDLPLFKNDITKILRPQRPVIYSRNMQATPIKKEGLLLTLPQSRTLLLWAGVIQPFIWAGLIGLGTSLGIAIFLARSVYRPLKRVTQAANEMAQGKYDHEIELSGPSEVVHLAKAFNEMARQVRLSDQRLRDFVADVSHQLRTPLTYGPTHGSLRICCDRRREHIHLHNGSSKRTRLR